MFYLPFKLREITQLSTPRGPNFQRAKLVSVNLGGNIVTLRLPRHKPVHPGYDDPIYLKGKIDIYDRGAYVKEMPEIAWGLQAVVQRTWRFNGPMFSGKLASLEFSMLLLKRDMPEGESLFNSEIFEREICGRLTVYYAEDKFRWASDWITPLNWQLHDQLPVFSASYDVMPRVVGLPKTEFVFPIADNCMVILYFRQMQLKDGGIEELDQLIDRSTMAQLCRDIIASTRLELSAESQQQLHWAQQEYPGVTLNPQMAPLKWTTPEEDEKHAYYLAHPHEF